MMVVGARTFSLDALPSCNGDYQLVLHRINNNGKSHMLRGHHPSSSSLEFATSFLGSAWPFAKSFSSTTSKGLKKKQKKNSKFLIVNEVAGQYEDSFEDVKTSFRNYFTYKAVRTVMIQLYELNPPQYKLFYDFVSTNNPGDGKNFLRKLGKENQELAERVMITRLHLYGKWIKKCDHTEIYNKISNQNLELMRERLKETVVWPSDDDTNDELGEEM